MVVATDNKEYRGVVEANIKLHSQLAEHYNSTEPHFRPENVEKVEKAFKALIQETGKNRCLDLGCGTGFMINIAKKHFAEIHGVDVTEAMLSKIDSTGSAKIVLHNCDSGTVQVDKGSFDLVTAYSFLHHLFDPVPTMKTAFAALKEGGKFFCDLEPNYYFWESISQLDRQGGYDSIVKREIEMVTYKDEDIQKQFGVDKEVFNSAEYGKSVMGGFKEEWLIDTMKSVGFKKVEVFYNWFIGQGAVINENEAEKSNAIQFAERMSNELKRSLPLSRNLFKYVGFVASK